MHVEERDIAFDFGRAECVWAATVFIEMPLSAAEHTFTQVGAPFLSMPIPLAPFALRGELFVGPVPRAVDSFDHSSDMS